MSQPVVKRVFSQLRRLCERRGVTWGEVDLRWGIPDEQQVEGHVPPPPRRICSRNDEPSPARHTRQRSRAEVE